MTDRIPYEVVEDDRGVRVIRGADLIGWAFSLRNAESFARELNALQSENGRLQSRVAKLESVLAKAAREVAAAGREYEDSDVSSIRLLGAIDELRDALEATDVG